MLLRISPCATLSLSKAWTWTLHKAFRCSPVRPGQASSILIDALQLALGSRGEAGVVREGAQRAEIVAEFDMPPICADWLVGAGFEPADALLLKRIIDAQGRSRAWINGGAATLAQLRELGESLVGHPWPACLAKVWCAPTPCVVCWTPMPAWMHIRWHWPGRPCAAPNASWTTPASNRAIWNANASVCSGSWPRWTS